MAAFGDDEPLIVVEHDRKFSPEEICSLLLSKLVKIAEIYLSTTAKDVVLIVPAHFNYFQRDALLHACTLSGLNVLRTLNKATCAAITYVLKAPRPTGDEVENVLIFHLGGGNLTVSIIAIEDEVIEVIAVGGNPHLGGEDIDNILVEHMKEEFKSKYKKDISTNQRAMTRMRIACERAKCALSSSSKATIEVDALHDGIDFLATITRVYTSLGGIS